MTPGCWIAEHIVLPGPCDGRLVKAHLIPQQLIKREFPFGAWVVDSHADRVPPPRRAPGDGVRQVVPLNVLLWDPRAWVPVCGGPTGCSGHHGALDVARSLRIPRDALPTGVEEYAAVLGLTWWLERTYGPLEMAA